MAKKQVTQHFFVSVTADEGTESIGDQTAQRIYTYQGVNAVGTILVADVDVPAREKATSLLSRVLQRVRLFK